MARVRATPVQVNQTDQVGDCAYELAAIDAEYDEGEADEGTFEHFAGA